MNDYLMNVKVVDTKYEFNHDKKITTCILTARMKADRIPFLDQLVMDKETDRFMGAKDIHLIVNHNDEQLYLVMNAVGLARMDPEDDKDGESKFDGDFGKYLAKERAKKKLLSISKQLHRRMLKALNDAENQVSFFMMNAEAGEEYEIDRIAGMLNQKFGKAK